MIQKPGKKALLQVATTSAILTLLFAGSTGAEQNPGSAQHRRLAGDSAARASAGKFSYMGFKLHRTIQAQVPAFPELDSSSRDIYLPQKDYKIRMVEADESGMLLILPDGYSTLREAKAAGLTEHSASGDERPVVANQGRTVGLKHSHYLKR